MMGDHLRRLLAPLGVYDLSAGSVSGAMLDALGDALDPVRQSVSDTLRDGFVQTAGDDALARWERISPPHGGSTAAQRRAAIAHLRGQEDVCCAKEQIEAALAACGLEASLTLSGDTVAVHSAQAQTAELTALARSLIPAHLDMTWVQE